MAIANRTRKLLWGKSGNRCAICRHELVVEAKSADEKSVVGEECHIVSSRPGGPRYRSDLLASNLDAYENLILLCRVHHKMVDDQLCEYSEGRLYELKKQHELWVRDRLAEGSVRPLRLRSAKGQRPAFLVRISSGKQLFNLVAGACAWYQDYPDPINESEADLFASLLQEIQDWADLSSDLESGPKVKAAFRLSELLNELEEAECWLFGGIETKILEGGVGPSSPWHVVHLAIVRCDDPAIISFGDGDSKERHA